MELKGKKVLITGAGGFIGSHLTEELVKSGIDTRVFIRYNSKGDLGNLEFLEPEVLDKIDIVWGDLKDIDGVRRAVESVDVIFHLGALISIPYSYQDPGNFMETNIIGTLNILREAQRNNVQKIVLTSTSEVYGTAITTPINEKHPLQAQSPYSASKISADKIGESFFKSFNVPIAIIRPFNTYGPRQSLRAIIPTIIYQALTKDKINLGSLSPKRDFTFVKDTVRGFINVAECDESIGKEINICSGKAISIGELVEVVGKILGRELIVETEEGRIRPEKSEVMLLLGDNSQAKKILNWEPSTDLKEGLQEVIKHVEENLEKFPTKWRNFK